MQLSQQSSGQAGETVDLSDSSGSYPWRRPIHLSLQIFTASVLAFTSSTSQLFLFVTFVCLNQSTT